MESLAITAFVLGIAYAAVPGAVNTESIRRAARSGFRPGFLVQLGSLVGDSAWAILGLSGAVILLQHDLVASALGFVGATLLLLLARQVLIAALCPSHDEPPMVDGSPLRIGLAFGLANPAGIAFWSGLGASIFGSTVPGLTSWVTLLVCFLAGALTWGTGLAYLVAWGSTRAGHRLQRIVDAVSAVVLGWFGVRLL